MLIILEVTISSASSLNMMTCIPLSCIREHTFPPRSSFRPNIQGSLLVGSTEYEFVDAYRNNQRHGKPYILLYRGMKKSFLSKTNPEQQTDLEQQQKAVKETAQVCC